MEPTVKKKILKMLTIKKFSEIWGPLSNVTWLYTFGLKITLQTILYIGKLWVQSEMDY